MPEFNSKSFSKHLLENNLKDAQSILRFLEKEVPIQVEMSVLLVATSKKSEDKVEKISNIEKAIAHYEKKVSEKPDDEILKATIARLKAELSSQGKKSRTKKTQSKEEYSEISLDEETVRKRIHVIFGAYLAFLEEKDSDSFQKAMSIIEKNISKRNKVLSKIKRQLRMQETQNLENATIKRASRYVSTVDKITQKLFNPDENPVFYENQEVLVEVGQTGGKKRKPVNTAVSVFFDNSKDISFSNDTMLDQYNNAVHSAVISMFCAGNNIFTINSLYHFMTGNNPTVKAPAEKTIAEIKNSLRKMAMTRVTINTENEAKLFKQIPIEVKTIERNLLYVDFVTAQINGQIVEAVKILAKPILLEYSEYKKQIASCEAKFLNAPLSETRDNTIIKKYLLDQILIMKNPNNKRNNVILYNTLYKILELDAPTEETLRAKKRDVRAKVHIILEYWKKEGFIKGYSNDIKEGNEITKIEIFLK